MRRRHRRLLSVFFIFLFLAAICYTWVWFNTPNSRVIGFFDDIPGTRLVVGGQLITGKNPPIVRDGHILLPFDTIKSCIDPYIWWDKNLQKITVTTKDRVIRMKTGSLDALINDLPMELKFPAVDQKGVIYLPIDFLKDFYNIDLKYSKTNNVIIIDSNEQAYRVCTPLSADAAVRLDMSIHEPIVRKFSEPDINTEASRLIIFNEYEKWYRVRTQDGVLGFIEKDDVALNGVLQANQKTPEPAAVHAFSGGKINLVWDMTYNGKSIEYSKASTPGIDILSPTWFEISDSEGGIKNRADGDYVEWAHANGWQVWALFSNDFSDLEGTSRILNNSDLRQEIIRQVLAYAALYHLDGINVDFENMYKSDKDSYTQFIREMYPVMKEQGLTVSVDVSVPGGSETWSQCFDRKALAQSADYVCLMAYDQYWASSPVAGSAAELDWVENRLKAVLAEVSPDRLLLGIPLYTRLWTEETINGQTKVSSRALAMADARRIIEENNAQTVWNPTIGQHTASFADSGKAQKMWVEDADAVNFKSSLIHKYGIAGACIWAANFADESVWPVLERNLKEVAGYEEWKSLYGTPTNN